MNADNLEAHFNHISCNDHTRNLLTSMHYGNIISGEQHGVLLPYLAVPESPEDDALHSRVTEQQRHRVRQVASPRLLVFAVYRQL